MLYQLSEFLICNNIAPRSMERVAIISITILPPTGILLTRQLYGHFYIDAWIYFIIAAGIIMYYMFQPLVIFLISCNPWYANYSIISPKIYGIYYLSALFWALGLQLYYIVRRRKVNNSFKKSLGNRKIGTKTITLSLFFSYLFFIVPVLIMISLDFSTAVSISSVMCKYALILAVTLFVLSFYDPSD